jgi:medium-chain acyl-[acyl-carrier-protein] hydrolase
VTGLPFGAGPDGAVRLFCLPHAGAGASGYRSWGEGLAGRVAVVPVQPPGRETRRRERPESRVGPLVRGLADELLPVLDAGPYAVFGHSTGAVCAFELCREVRRRGGRPPEHLFVSGRRAPQLPEKSSGLETLDLPALAAVLRRHGGTPDWVLNGEGMLRLLRPLLVADFALSEDYGYRPEPPLMVPLTAFAADRDPRATMVQVAAWRAQTTGPFTLHPLCGGHFAVLERAADVHDAIASALT